MKLPWLPRPNPAELIIAATIVAVLLFATLWLALGHPPPVHFWIAGWGAIMSVVLAAAFRRKVGKKENLEGG